MEFRHLTNLALRPKPLNRALRSSRISTQPRSIHAHSSRKSLNPSQTAHTFSTQPTRPQQAAAPKQIEEDEQPRTEQEANETSRKQQVVNRFTTDQGQTQSQPQSQANSQPKRKSEANDSILDFLDRAKSSSSSSSSQQSSSTTRPQLHTFNPRDLVPGTELSFLRPSKSSSSSSPSSSSSSSQNTTSSLASRMTSLSELTRGISARDSKQTFDLSSMRQPYNPTGSQGYSPLQLKKYNDTLQKAIAPPSFHLGPSLGRTVNVDLSRGYDVARALQLVNVKCAANSIARDFRKQKFHERPGLRRKRQRSQRWRKRFAESFKATVRRVQEMRRKGW